MPSKSRAMFSKNTNMYWGRRPSHLGEHTTLGGTRMLVPPARWNFFRNSHFYVAAIYIVAGIHSIAWKAAIASLPPKGLSSKLIL